MSSWGRSVRAWCPTPAHYRYDMCAMRCSTSGVVPSLVSARRSALVSIRTDAQQLTAGFATIGRMKPTNRGAEGDSVDPEDSVVDKDLAAAATFVMRHRLPESFYFPAATSDICRLCDEYVAPKQRNFHLVGSGPRGPSTHLGREIVLDSLMYWGKLGYEPTQIVMGWARDILRADKTDRIDALLPPLDQIHDVERRAATVSRILRYLVSQRVLEVSVSPHAPLVGPGSTQSGVPSYAASSGVSLAAGQRIAVKHRVSFERCELIGDNSWGSHLSCRMMTAFSDKQWQDSAMHHTYNAFRDLVESNANLEAMYDVLRLDTLLSPGVRDLVGAGKIKADVFEAVLGELYVQMWSSESCLFHSEEPRPELSPKLCDALMYADPSSDTLVGLDSRGSGHDDNHRGASAPGVGTAVRAPPRTTVPYQYATGRVIDGLIRHVLTEINDLTFLSLVQRYALGAVPIAQEISGKHLWVTGPRPLLDVGTQVRTRRPEFHRNFVANFTLPRVPLLQSAPLVAPGPLAGELFGGSQGAKSTSLVVLYGPASATLPAARRRCIPSWSMVQPLVESSRFDFDVERARHAESASLTGAVESGAKLDRIFLLTGRLKGQYDTAGERLVVRDTPTPRSSPHRRGAQPSSDQRMRGGCQPSLRSTPVKDLSDSDSSGNATLIERLAPYRRMCPFSRLSSVPLHGARNHYGVQEADWQQAWSLQAERYFTDDVDSLVVLAQYQAAEQQLQITLTRQAEAAGLIDPEQQGAAGGSMSDAAKSQQWTVIRSHLDRERAVRMANGALVPLNVAAPQNTYVPNQPSATSAAVAAAIYSAAGATQEINFADIKKRNAAERKKSSSGGGSTIHIS